MDVDLAKPLPYASGSVDFILLEHVLEHLTSREGWLFLEEVHRVLSVGGVARIICPDILAMRHGWRGRTMKECARATACDYGHKMLWTREVLCKVLGYIGFVFTLSRVHEPVRPEFRGAEGHDPADGSPLAVEAIKLLSARK
jgi:predicted SAM-dependent methyltransferase